MTNRYSMADLPTVPAEELLAEVANPAKYQVTLVNRQSLAEGEFSSYQLVSHAAGGEPVVLSVRVLIAKPDEEQIVFSIPGGAGVFPDQTIVWLARLLKKNQACVDWVSRGQSPKHPSVYAIYDPLYITGDSYRDSYMYHNTIALWAAINWLFSIGLKPTSLVGGSWGGVYSFLLSCYDPRIRRIYPTFGCGGFLLPGVDRRNLWDEAIRHVGEKRAAAWFAAFDPLLRLHEQKATVYLETATNDKFFSLGMIGATWEKVQRKGCLAFAYNQDHMMVPYGKQPYLLESFDERGVNYEHLKQHSQALSISWQAGLNSIIAWPVAEGSNSKVRLVWSEQLPKVSSMSRAWKTVAPVSRSGSSVLFEIEPSHPKSEIAYYIDLEDVIEGERIRVSSPMRMTSASERGCSVQTRPPLSMLYETPIDGDIWTLPVGDKRFPKMQVAHDVTEIHFGGVAQERFARFGIHSWRIDPDWKQVVLSLKSDCNKDFLDDLWVFMSKNYMRHDEIGIACPLSRASSAQSGEKIIEVCISRSDFSPVYVRENRFDTMIDPSLHVSEIARSFDAIGMISLKGEVKGVVGLFSIKIE